jgi:uncharacterized membrane protein (DUF106 family)
LFYEFFLNDTLKGFVLKFELLLHSIIITLLINYFFAFQKNEMEKGRERKREGREKRREKTRKDEKRREKTRKDEKRRKKMMRK